MNASSPSLVLLKDYCPPAFIVDDVNLFFELHPEATRVTCRQQLQRRDRGDTDGHLVLMGEQMQLESVKINDRLLPAAAYTADEDSLTIMIVPEGQFSLEIVTVIQPVNNTSLEGLYMSNGMFCTQCEAQGFRRITYFLDRPDVMARFSATLVADRTAYPVLLANGNPVASGELVNNRHWVRWEDPHKKPCYLFALVAGQLECLEDRFVTMSGREVSLHIYVEAHDLDKCDHAMHSLKASMRWDEQRFGREYDLDRYMIVAVSHFNMGAMENKGLNIFNTKFVLARPDTATDADYEQIEAVIGHEYFHNWSGNRVTCRDWFQLSLKEGFTVYRDQEFTADQTSRAVKRIHDVNLLRTRQFAEDAGPLSHPVRPESYLEINNFYTLTVYEKGAEVVRMLATLLGDALFRRGTDLFFERFDGQAVTCDDFVACMEEVSGRDLSHFRLWYSQAGTPVLTLSETYDEALGELTLTVVQRTDATPGQADKYPLHMPLALGLLDADGRDLPVCLAGEAADTVAAGTRVLELTEAEHCFRLQGLSRRPVLSPLRGFSAPVNLEYEQSDASLLQLFMHDSDGFNRWNAGQRLVTRRFQNIYGSCQGHLVADDWADLVAAFRHILQEDTIDAAYQALLLTLPSEDYLALQVEVVDPVRISDFLLALRLLLASSLAPVWEQAYGHHQQQAAGQDGVAVGHRRMQNVCLAYLALLETEASRERLSRQYREAINMTDQLAALHGMVNSEHPGRDAALDAFYQQWRQEALVIDKWFALQAGSRVTGTLTHVKQLLAHADFDLRVPNRVRSLIAAFSQANPAQFHAADGSGYHFLGEQVAALDAINPQVAARMAVPLTGWRRYDAARQSIMQTVLQELAAMPTISRDLYEVVSKGLG